MKKIVSHLGKLIAKAPLQLTVMRMPFIRP